MSDKFEDVVRVVDDSEVEPPILVDSRLPEVFGLIVLLGYAKMDA
jgi:hypothetical protein